MWWYDHGAWWSWLIMSLGMVAIWGLVLWGILAVLRGGSRDAAPRTTPEQILRERFAAGEIDELEFRDRLEALRASERRHASAT